MEIYFDATDHSYTSEYGQVFIPVTTICGHTPRAVDFRSLPRQDVIRKSAERGSMIHGEIEAFIKHGAVGVSKTFEWFRQVLYPLYTDWQSEVIIYVEEGALPYAGTIDLIARFKDRWIIIDLKTGGHETVDYQLSLYKRGFCIRNGIDPSIVDLACIDARDEDNIKVFNVRQIPDAWLDDLLDCVAQDLPYSEPLPALKGVSEAQLVTLTQLERYISTIEAELKSYQDKRDEYREKLFKAMNDALVDTFEFGSLKVTRVEGSTSTSFDSAKFKKEHKDLYEKYTKTTQKSGYLKVTVRDITKKEK